jgi:putative sigma-54 modulation protein
MRLIYSGKTKEFTPELEEKITGKLAKLSKLIEQRGEREAHVTHCMERHLHKVELIVNFYDHALVAEGMDADLETALCEAAEKLESNALKARNRWRDTHRDSKSVRSSKENWDQGPGNGEPEATAPIARRNGTSPRKAKVFRVNYDEGRKPMTLEEALLEIEKDDYVVYRDADKNCLSVLLRRSDGNYDLIES